MHILQLNKFPRDESQENILTAAHWSACDGTTAWLATGKLTPGTTAASTHQGKENLYLLFIYLSFTALLQHPLFIPYWFCPALEKIAFKWHCFILEPVLNKMVDSPWISKSISSAVSVEHTGHKCASTDPDLEDPGNTLRKQMSKYNI